MASRKTVSVDDVKSDVGRSSTDCFISIIFPTFENASGEPLPTSILTSAVVFAHREKVNFL